jgi:phosphoesterase RecJ-like protein
MPLSEAAIQAASTRIRLAQNILVVSHIRPDGDAIGSLIGLGLALMQDQHTVQMVVEDGVPASLRHLDGNDLVRRKPEGAFDLIISVDCSDLERIGNALNGQPAPEINIDHHVTNLNFAAINLIDDQAASTSEILVEIFPKFGLQLSQPVAEALLTGLITDTLGFRTSNVSPNTFLMAARLIETGVDLPELYRRALIDRSFEAVRFWGAGLEKLERSGRLVWTSLTMVDRVKANYPGRDDADLINVLSSIEDTDISLIFVEQPNGNIKVSWRAQPGYDVSKVAVEFGGGGHAGASGAEIAGSLLEVQKQVLEKTRPLFNGGYRV